MKRTSTTSSTVYMSSFCRTLDANKASDTSTQFNFIFVWTNLNLYSIILRQIAFAYTKTKYLSINWEIYIGMEVGGLKIDNINWNYI